MKKAMVVLLLCAALPACSREKVQERAGDAANKVVEKIHNVFEAAVPLGRREDPAAREQQRFDERWRQLRWFREELARRREQRRIQKALANLRFVTGVKETFKGLDVNAINTAPIAVPIKGDVAGPSVLKTQVYLDRVHFSVGVLDGRWGRNSAISLWWYQRARGLGATGEVDENTFRALASEAEGVPAIVAYQVTEDDLKGPFTSIPEDIYAKAELRCLCYESRQEKLAEKFHTTTDFLDRLNPDVKFSELRAGDSINVPNVRPPIAGDQPDIAKIVISIAGNTFNAYDAAGNVIFHAPTTLGSTYDPSPNETVYVREIIRDPHFHYQPKLFHEVPDTDPEAMLNPGPNSPVGVVWIALSKAHFGIHGTSDPDSIGYVSSHGCVRLTNWDADEVSHRITKGVPVEFVDTRHESS